MANDPVLLPFNHITAKIEGLTPEEAQQLGTFLLQARTRIVASTTTEPVESGSNVPDAPNPANRTRLYNLRVEKDGDVKWTEDSVPTNAERNVQADWRESNSANDAYIKNKPAIPNLPVEPLADSTVREYNLKVATDGTVTWAVDADAVDLPDKPGADTQVKKYNLNVATDGTATWTEDTVSSGGEVNVQADWKETTSTSDAYIKNKPTVPDTPSKPATPSAATEYNLKVGTDGTATWTADTGAAAFSDLTGTIAASQIPNSRIESAMIKDLAITDAKLAKQGANQVLRYNSAGLPNPGLITADNIRKNAIETAKIKDLAVTEAKLATALSTKLATAVTSGSNVPDKPDTPDADREYNLKIASDGTAAWTEDAGGVDLPSKPAKDTAIKHYNLKVATDGTTTWAEDTGEANVQVDWEETTDTSDAYIKNKPTIPAAQIQADWGQATDTSLDYIKNKPTIPAKQVQADWGQTESMSVDYIKNKPTIPDVPSKPAKDDAVKEYKLKIASDGTATWAEEVVGDAATLPGKPGADTQVKRYNLNIAVDGTATWTEDTVGEGGEANVQANWKETTTTSDAYIKNKPTIPAAQIQADWGQTTNTSLDYIKNKPTIPAAQIQADWGQATDTSLDYIKNKPTVPDTPGKPAKDTAIKHYSLKVAVDGTATWAEDTGEANVQVDWEETGNTSDAYIKNKPTIPAKQIQADWSQTTNTELDYIKNKPTVPNTPSRPAKEAAVKEYNLKIATDGTGTWAEDTGIDATARTLAAAAAGAAATAQASADRLPNFPAAGSRDNKILVFDDDALGWGEHLDKIATQIANIDTRLDSIQSQLNNADDRLDTVQDQADLTDERIDGVQLQLTNADERIDTTEDRLDLLEAHVATESPTERFYRRSGTSWDGGTLLPLVAQAVRGIAEHSNGDVSVVDGATRVVYTLAASNSTWNAGIPLPDEAKEPHGLALDSAGDIVVLDETTQKYYTYSSGAWDAGVDLPTAAEKPTGMAFHSDGSPVVLDAAARTFFKRTAGTWDAGVALPAQALKPQGISVNASDHVMVADTSTGRFFTRAGTTWDTGQLLPSTADDARGFFVKSNGDLLLVGAPNLVLLTARLDDVADNLATEAARIDAESERLTVEANRLDDVAADLVTEAERLDAEAQRITDVDAKVDTVGERVTEETNQIRKDIATKAVTLALSYDDRRQVSIAPGSYAQWLPRNSAGNVITAEPMNWNDVETLDFSIRDGQGQNVTEAMPTVSRLKLGTLITVVSIEDVGNTVAFTVSEAASYVSSGNVLRIPVSRETASDVGDPTMIDPRLGTEYDMVVHIPLPAVIKTVTDGVDEVDMKVKEVDEKIDEEAEQRRRDIAAERANTSLSYVYDDRRQVSISPTGWGQWLPRNPRGNVITDTTLDWNDVGAIELSLGDATQGDLTASLGAGSLALALTPITISPSPATGDVVAFWTTQPVTYKPATRSYLIPVGRRPSKDEGTVANIDPRIGEDDDLLISVPLPAGEVEADIADQTATWESSDGGATYLPSGGQELDVVFSRGRVEVGRSSVFARLKSDLTGFNRLILFQEGDTQTLTTVEDAPFLQVHRLTHVSSGASALVRFTARIVANTAAPGIMSAPTVTQGAYATLVVEFTPPLDVGSSAITRFELRAINTDDASDANNSTVYQIAPSQRSATIVGLKLSTTYAVSMRARNAAGVPAWSSAVEIDTGASYGPVPDKITTLNGRYDAAAPSVTYTWTTPAGYSGITGYKLRYRKVGVVAWTEATAAAAATSYTISSVTKEAQYEFQVRATNRVGDAPWSDSVTVRTSTTSKPGAPGLSLTIGGSRITAQMTSPLNTGGLPITGYKVQWKSGAENYDAATRQTTTVGRSSVITGLVNGRTYTVRALAANSLGDGAWSAEKTAAPGQAPSAPTIVVRASDGQVTVTPSYANNGGAALQTHWVQWKSGNQGYSSTNREISFTGSSRTITGLSNGTTYTFRVQGSNGIGTSPWSAEVRATPSPAATRPAKPSLTASAGDGRISLVATSGGTGGSPITRYEFQWKSGAQSYATNTRFRSQTGRTYTISPLTNGVAYTVRVRTVNAIGDSDWSTERTATPARAVTQAGKPGLAITAGAERISVRITAPASNGGATITAYKIQWKSSTQSYSTAREHETNGATSYTITGLTAGVLYTVRVAAVNRAGDSDWSTERTARPSAAATRPGKPTLSASAGDGRIALTATAGTTGGSAITGYEFQWKSGAQSYSTSSRFRAQTGRTYTITNLTNGTAYSVRVRSVNVVGKSDWSTERTATPVRAASTPGQPGLTVWQDFSTLEDDYLFMDVTAPSSDGGQPITGYKVQWKSGVQDYDDSRSLTNTTGDFSSRSKFRGGRTYTFRALVTNSIGNSEWSSEVTINTVAPGVHTSTSDWAWPSSWTSAGYTNAHVVIVSGGGGGGGGGGGATSGYGPSSTLAGDGGRGGRFHGGATASGDDGGDGELGTHGDGGRGGHGAKRDPNSPLDTFTSANSGGAPQAGTTVPVGNYGSGGGGGGAGGTSGGNTIVVHNGSTYMAIGGEGGGGGGGAGGGAGPGNPGTDAGSKAANTNYNAPVAGGGSGGGFGIPGGSGGNGGTNVVGFGISQGDSISVTSLGKGGLGGRSGSNGEEYGTSGVSSGQPGTDGAEGRLLILPG